MRHDRRDDAGRFRTPTDVETLAHATRSAIVGRGGKHQALMAALGYGDPLAGRIDSTARPTLEGGYIPQGPTPARVQDDAKEEFLDAMFPNRAAGRNYHPYSLTHDRNGQRLG